MSDDTRRTSDRTVDPAMQRLGEALVSAQRDVLAGFLHPDMAVRDALARRAMETMFGALLPDTREGSR